LGFGIWDLGFQEGSFSFALLMTLCYKYKSTAMRGRKKVTVVDVQSRTIPFALFRVREKAPGAL